MSKNGDTHRTNIGFGLGVAAIVLLLFIYYASTWRSAANFKAAIDTCAGPFCDFVSFYYPMGEAIFRTGLPVQGFVYSPFIAILFAIFPPFGLNVSLILWGILQTLAILFYLILFRRLVPTGQQIQLLFIFLALSSFPLLHTLTWGQVGVITTVSILGALFFYERGQRVTAAFLFAFSISFKFFPIIFLIPFIIRRDFRFLLIAAIVCGFFLFIVPAILLGIDDVAGYYTALLNSYRNFDWVITNYNSQHFPHVMGRLTEAAGFDARAHLSILRWIGYGIAAVNTGLVFLIQCARLPQVNLWGFHILFLSIPFVLPTSWPVDLVYLPFGQVLLAWKILEGDNAPSWKNSLPVRKVAALLLLISIVVSNIVFFNFIGDSFAYGSFGFIFWANLLILVVSYMELLPSVLQQFRTTSNRLVGQGG